jgi:hypothetical protein
MGKNHFLTKILANVNTEMSLHGLTYNMNDFPLFLPLAGRSLTTPHDGPVEPLFNKLPTAAEYVLE